MCSSGNPIQNTMLMINMSAFKSNTSNIIQANCTILVPTVERFTIHPIIFNHLELHVRKRISLCYMYLKSALLTSIRITKASTATPEAISNYWATISDAAANRPQTTFDSISASIDKTDDYHQANNSSHNWSNYNGYLFVIFIALLQCVICLGSIVIVAAGRHAFAPRWGCFGGVLTTVGVIIAVCYIVVADCPFAKLEVEGCAVLACALNVKLAAKSTHWWITAVSNS